MEDNKYSVDDLVVSAIQQKPVEFEQAFGNLMVDRLQSAVENRKQEIAQTMFQPPVYNDDEIETSGYEETETDLETEEEDNGETFSHDT
jgi:hypothetical protein